VTATMIVVAIVLTAGLILVNASGTQSQTVTVAGNPDNSFSANVILNGRISAWSAALGDDPAEWVLGRGVGEVGTAAERSTYTVTRSSDSDEREQAVDSGYLATIADVGFVGLGVLLVLFAFLAGSATRAARRGLDEGWVALALLATLLLDALTRASFTGFPTAFLGLLLVGVAIASAGDRSSGDDGSAGRRH